MFIKREDATKVINDYAQALYRRNDWKMGETADECASLLCSIPDAYVVSIKEWNQMNFERCVLVALLKGEWVPCADVQEAMNITFEQGRAMFDYGICGPWNGERIGEKFRIGEKTLTQNKVKGFEEDFEIRESKVSSRPNPDTHQWELILEQQGGII